VPEAGAAAAEGLQADLVVFDEQRVRPAMPTVETDLPVRVSGRCGAAPVRDVTPRV